MGLINNIQSGIVKGRIITALAKIDIQKQLSALDNLMESTGLTDKDAREVKTALANKLGEAITKLEVK
jgi:hypothetical protein